MNRKLIIGVLTILAVLAVVFALARAQVADVTMTPPQCTETDGVECTSSGDLGAGVGLFEFQGVAKMADGSQVTAGPGVFVKCTDLQAKGEGNKIVLTWKCPKGAAISFGVKKK